MSNHVNYREPMSIHQMCVWENSDSRMPKLLVRFLALFLIPCFVAQGRSGNRFVSMVIHTSAGMHYYLAPN